MRIRNRSLTSTPILFAPNGVDYYSPPETFQYHTDFSPAGGCSQLEGSEYMEDSDVPKRASVNDVIHYSALCQRELIDSYVETYSDINKYISSGPMAHWYSWGSYGAIPSSAISVVWGMTETALVRKALDKFYNENEVDNLLNIIESPQLLTPLRNILRYLGQTDTKTALRDLARGLKNPQKVVKTVTGAHLAYSFGIAPLVSDMMKMSAAIPEIRRAYKQAYSSTGNYVTKYSRAAGKPSLNTSGLTGYGPGYPGGGFWKEASLKQTSPCISIATVYGIRDRPRYYNSTLQKVDRFMRTYVTGGPASFLWERLPFSFVADWFVDTSGVINSLNESLTGLGSTIKRLSVSYKYALDIPVVKTQGGLWVSDSDGKITCNNTIKYYHRKSIRPDLIGPSSRFGKRQAALSVSLAQQSLAKFRAI